CVVRIGSERRQRSARRDVDSATQVQSGREDVIPERLELMRPIEWKDSVWIAQESDVTSITELRYTDRGVARVVGGEVVQRRDARVGLSIVVAVEALEVATQARPPVGRNHRPVVGQAPVQRDVNRMVAVLGVLE